MGRREVPLGINTTIGAVAVILCCVVPGGMTGPGVNARLGVLAVGLVAFSAAVVDSTAVVISIGVGFLLFDGFVEGDHGTLVWHGQADLIRLAVLCVAGAIGLLLGALRRWRERLPTARSPVSLVTVIPRQRTSSDSDAPARPSGTTTAGPLE